ncbi:hypothetical protein PO124_00370 [Bacillus licheniformis]|nr:hypothetical protein [Bacillus licheniformis]
MAKLLNGAGQPGVKAQLTLRFIKEPARLWISFFMMTRSLKKRIHHQSIGNQR